ncbi:MAG: Gfo/Idh/MocA family oxidoreductase [Planctomycetota bacterium]|nr:Gfo/Idh/MocA family oxidoreductase [Planctomycetota bacterium]
MTKKSTRRSFVVQSGSLAAGVAVAPSLSSVHVSGSDEIKVAVIGCGGRGTGAASQIMNSKGNTRLIAVADAFPDKAAGRVNQLKKRYGDKVDVPQDRMFGGLDGFKKAVDCGPDVVVIATPPGFKPQQFEYAVSKGKHVFMEKPVASDTEGVRRVLAANQVAKDKNLMVGIGLQRRHEERYQDCVKRLQDGAIGDINLLRVYWNGGGIWDRPREQGMTEMQFQVNNWYHFIWASGDQICEQHIHNLDVGCWVKDMYPIEANGMGGRERRLDGDRSKSQIFDHTFVEYTFPDGTKMYSQGRHLRNAFNSVAEFAHGSKGISKVGGWIEPHGAKRMKIRGKGGGHQQEQHDLIESLMKGEIYNEGDYGAKSTFTAILGREACYSGKALKWDDLMKRGKDYCPGIDQYTFDSEPPVVRDAKGLYPVPLAGIHNPFVEGKRKK